MTDLFFDQFPTTTTLITNELITVETDPTGTDITKTIDWTSLQDLIINFQSYQISASVASNNLTVAIKYIDGNDPSTTKSIKFKVGNTVYALTAAVSFQKNAATNWCALGSAELAAQATDLFMYAIGETGASAGLKFGFSRISHARTMSDFINTSTSQKYIAGNWTNFNSTDVVTVIGRFRAQLSASASFNWSIASSVVVNYPIYETDWLTWIPTVTGYSANPTNTNFRYKVFRHRVTCQGSATGTGTSNATTKSYTLPFTSATIANNQWGAPLPLPFDNGANLAAGIMLLGSNSATLNMYKSAAAAWTNTGTCIAWQYGQFDYEI